MKACVWIHGTCSENPGPGGWSALIKQVDNPTERRLANGASSTTSNRILLIAAINALEALDHPSDVTIITKSAYLRDGATRWIKSWKSNGWKRKQKRKKGKPESFKPVGNVDLWKQIDALQSVHKVTWKTDKGHTNHNARQRLDKLAKEGIAPFIDARPPKARTSPHKARNKANREYDVIDEDDDFDLIE